MSGAGGVDLLAETEDQTALRQLARDVASREVAPRASQGDETGEVPPEVRKALASADLLRITIGEQWGGMGLGDVEASIVLEEIARADVSSAICCQLTFNGPPRGIEHLGPEAMKERWLPAAADGDALISIGITEPDAGSAVQNMRAALTEDGPGRWRLNAYKNYSTLGHVAQGVLVWCRWPGGEGAKGIGAVVVPTDREGVSVTGRHKGMGIHAATEAELAFDGVAITEDDILIAGDPGEHVRLQGPTGPPQPRALRQRRRCASGRRRAPWSTPCATCPSGSSAAARWPTSRACSGSWPTWPSSWKGPGSSWAAPSAWPVRAAPRLRWRPRWPRRPPTWPPSSSATRPCRSTGATATATSTRWSGPTATSAACASAPARWRRSATSSASGWRRAAAPARRAGARGSRRTPGVVRGRERGPRRFWLVGRMVMSPISKEVVTLTPPCAQQWNLGTRYFRLHRAISDRLNDAPAEITPQGPRSHQLHSQE